MNKPQLFLLHFAGGNKYSFNFLFPYLKKFDVIGLELPGRGTRLKETLIKNYQDAVEDLTKQLYSNLKTENFIIYGHSMGATLGLLIAKKLEDMKKPPLKLIVSGNAGPDVLRSKIYHTLPDDLFLLELEKFGGLPKELLNNRDIMNFFLPMLKSDFEIVEKEEIKAVTIQSPIYAIAGSEESASKKLKNWKKYTEAKFEFEILEGNHFFIHKHAERLAEIINQSYDTGLVL